MSTDRRSSRVERRNVGAVAVLLTIAALAMGPGASSASMAAPPRSSDVPPRGGDAVVVAVRGAASALAPARRISIDPTKPIFPMQTAPVCAILDNFGDGRSGGRVHQGTDILATLGQEVYATVDGTLGHKVLAGAASSSLAGNAWRLTASASATWYVYMHLSGFAPGLVDGSPVRQGQVIGYVGDTGNPGPGNYHLHFEVHPGGGAAVNALTVLPIPAACSVH